MTIKYLQNAWGNFLSPYISFKKRQIFSCISKEDYYPLTLLGETGKGFTLITRKPVHAEN